MKRGYYFFCTRSEFAQCFNSLSVDLEIVITLQDGSYDVYVGDPKCFEINMHFHSLLIRSVTNGSKSEIKYHAIKMGREAGFYHVVLPELNAEYLYESNIRIDDSRLTSSVSSSGISFKALEKSIREMCREKIVYIESRKEYPSKCSQSVVQLCAEERVKLRQVPVKLEELKVLRPLDLIPERVIDTCKPFWKSLES